MKKPKRTTEPKPDAATIVPLDPSNILTVEELAARLKVAPTWVYENLRPRNENRLPAFKCGRYLRFYWPEISEWLRGRRLA